MLATSATSRTCCRSRKEFPGLHQAVSAFARLTGLPLWPAGMIVIVLAHVLSVLAVYQLVRAVGASARGAAVGAVVYTLNPSWVYFDAAVSYESLALPVLLWCLAATVAASRAPERPNLRYIAVAMLCVAALPMIHHLTTIILCLILALLIVAGLVPPGPADSGRGRGAPRERLWPLMLTASCLLASITYWWSDKYEWLLSYLSPALTRGWTQLSQLLGCRPGPGGSRPANGRCSVGRRTRPMRSSAVSCSRPWCWCCSWGPSPSCGATGVGSARRRGRSRCWGRCTSRACPWC